MAELLIKLEEAGNPADLKAWSRGHVVAIKPDGWQWGGLECPPKFCVIHITDVVPEEVLDYIQPHVEPVSTTKTWILKQWQNAQAREEYGEFVSVPVAGEVVEKIETITVTEEQYNKMVESEDFGRFTSAPSVQDKNVLPDLLKGPEVQKELTGIVSYVDVTGDIQTQLAVRKYRFDFDDEKLPKEIADATSTGKVSVLHADITDFIKRTMDG